MPQATMIKWDEARTKREADPHNKALIEAEYAAEREHFERVRSAGAWKRRLLTLLIIFAVAAAAWQIRGVIVETKDNTVQVHNLTRSLQSAVIESCEKNGNERAKVKREQLHEEIAETKHLDPEAFNALVKAGIPPEVIRRSAAKSRHKLENRLARVKIVDCAAQYHISPGSGTRRRDQK